MLSWWQDGRCLSCVNGIVYAAGTGQLSEYPGLVLLECNVTNAESQWKELWDVAENLTGCDLANPTAEGRQLSVRAQRSSC